MFGRNRRKRPSASPNCFIQQSNEKMVHGTQYDPILRGQQEFQMSENTSKTFVWLDCDPGLDDTFALIYAAHSPHLHLLGVSTSPGNSSLAKTTRNALDILYNIGRSDVPVFAGSNILIKGQMKLAQAYHGSNGLGGVNLPSSPQKAITEHSFQKIYSRISKADQKVTWVNTGSLTNLCLFLLSYPDIREKIERIVMMGGAIGKGNITPAAEFNIYFDPHAFQGVLKLKGPIPLVMIPLEVTHQNLATQQVFDQISQHRAIPFAAAIYNMLQQFKIMYFQCEQFESPPIHDPCTIFYLLHPEEFIVQPAKIEVDVYPASYGRTNCFFLGGGKRQTEDLVATSFKNGSGRFWEEMLKILDRVFSEDIQSGISHATDL